MKTKNIVRLVIVTAVLFMGIPRTACAQLKEENIPGDFGLQSGTIAYTLKSLAAKKE